MNRFTVTKISEEQYEVWDNAIPDILNCYDNVDMAQDHAKRALKSYNEEMKSK